MGVYGLRTLGLDAARRVLDAAEPSWPSLRVDVGVSSADPEYDTLDNRSARYRMHGGGYVTIDRKAGVARLLFPHTGRRPTPEEIVHPYLFSSAATINFWLGRHTFHAGAFVIDGGAWAIAGDKGAGKSSMLAWLALHGVPVLCDDLLVVDDGTALAGPACIDLRSQPAHRLGIGEDIGVVGTRARWRYVLGARPPRVPLRGWILPAWGDDLTTRALPASERIPRLLGNVALRATPKRLDALLDICALPCIELTRQQRWETLPSAVDRMLAAVAAALS